MPSLTDANFRKWSLNFGCAAKLHHTAWSLDAPAPKITQPSLSTGSTMVCVFENLQRKPDFLSNIFVQGPELISYVLNFYLPKSCFRILISIQNLNQYLETQFKFQNCKSLHKWQVKCLFRFLKLNKKSKYEIRILKQDLGDRNLEYMTKYVFLPRPLANAPLESQAIYYLVVFDHFNAALVSNFNLH